MTARALVLPVLLLPVLLLLAACASEAERPAPPAPPTPGAPAEATASASAPDTLVVSTETRALTARPTAPVRVDGACPFEGCQYGTWTTSAETTVYAAADTASAAFTVPAGTALEAPGGFVLVTRVGVSVATEPTELFLSFRASRPLAAGDTVLVLDYEGEGSYRVWHDGQVGFSSAGSADAGGPFRQLVAPEQQWWARVAAPDGRAGWLWMDRTPNVDGADALAAP